MIIAFDLDDVLCTRSKYIEHLGIDKYKYCEPDQKMINIVNELYEKGHYIKIYTARGMTQFNGDVEKIYKELFNITKNSLDSWGVRYHQLVMGKEHYDLLIDDKAINSLLVNSVEDISL